MTKLVLVTGASGFIGSHLVDRLLSDGARVRCLQHVRALGYAAGRAEICHGDVRDTSAVQAAMQGVSIVFHLAGIASVGGAHAAPENAFQVSTLGTQNMLEAARAAGVKRFALLSSAHVFGRPRSLPLTDEHPVVPNSIYAATKLAAEVLALGYYRSFGLPVSVLRSFNVYGPRQDIDAVIPTIVAQAVAGLPIKVRELRPQRDFIYVDDVVEALVRSVRMADVSGVEMILASGRPVSIASLIRRVMALVSAKDVEFPEELASNGDCMFGNAARARALLGWEPKVDLEAGLARTIDWWRAYTVAATLRKSAV